MSAVSCSARMRLLLIMPDANIHRLSLGPIKMSFREAPLTLTTLAALVPSELNADITIVDESIQSIPFNKQFDLVGISCLTGTAYRAYEIADRFRSAGAKVVLGGVHATLRPDEAKLHADAVVLGFAESTWPELLRDLVTGGLKRVYANDSVDLSQLPIPRRDLQKRFGYMAPNTVFATRGCKGACEFCSVAAVPFGWHTRPVHEVIDEIRQIRSNRIVFNDVSITEDREYARELFAAMVPLKKKWGGLATVGITADDELLGLMRESGCIYLLIGFETLERKGLAGINKDFNSQVDYASAVQKLQSLGIIVQGCFILGLDHDQKNVFEKTVQAVNDLKIDIPRFAIYTPYPETQAFKRLKEAGRLLHEYWPHYDTQHVVFQPENMTPQELDAGFRWAYRQTFSMASIARRTLGSKHFAISFLGNVAYKLYVRRLQTDVTRIHPEGTL
jgi:radical SAM superfamily enzyme YgiQ (UPF0313 family)